VTNPLHLEAELLPDSTSAVIGAPGANALPLRIVWFASDSVESRFSVDTAWIESLRTRVDSI
jgi:hypothetical protein